MNVITKKNARLDIRLSSESKRIIEQAAVLAGKSVSDFTLSAVLPKAYDVLRENGCTLLSSRDWDMFIETLEAVETEPNEALSAAAHQYKEVFRKSSLGAYPP